MKRTKLTKVEKDLLVASRCLRGKYRQKFLRAVMICFQNISDDDWEAMYDETQEWVNQATKATKKNAKIKDFTNKAFA